jgi:hypothetical protein
MPINILQAKWGTKLIRDKDQENESRCYLQSKFDKRC